MGNVLAIYDSESSPGQKLEVQWDANIPDPTTKQLGVMVCTCLHYQNSGVCKHILDYDLTGGQAAEKVVDDSHSSSPQPKTAAPPPDQDGIDAVEFEKPSTRELEPSTAEAVKEAARKMKEG